MPWVKKSADEEFATAEMMFESMGGVFAPEEVDHKCKFCWMRVLIDKGDIADCTIVKGGISLKLGSCNFWDPGEASSQEDIAEERIDYATAGYVEAPSEDFVIACMTCKPFYRPDGEESGACLLWGAKVKAMQCSQGYVSEEVKTPEKPHLSN